MVIGNKRGWIRIVEASIAILIIFTVIFAVAEKRKAPTESDLSEIVNPLLEEIAQDVALREVILKDTSSSTTAEETITSFLSDRITSPNIGFDARICNYDEYCGLDKIPEGAKGSIYADSRIITATIDIGTTPKKLNLFLWAKE